MNRARPSKTPAQHNERDTFFSMLGRYDCHVLLFSFSFFLTSIHPLSRLSALCMPARRSRGPPGEQTHTGGYVAVPQSPLSLPPCSLYCSVCLRPSPLCPCLYAPSVCLMTWLLIRPEAPTVPSAWCQHFPPIQSQPCCVTDGIGDQKQQPRSYKKRSKNYETMGLLTR